MRAERKGAALTRTRRRAIEMAKHMASISESRDPGKADKQFLASYEHGGSDWSLQFYALDWSDAQRKITSIRRTLELDGEAVAAIKLPWFRWRALKLWWIR